MKPPKKNIMTDMMNPVMAFAEDMFATMLVELAREAPNAINIEPRNMKNPSFLRL